MIQLTGLRDLEFNLVFVIGNLDIQIICLKFTAHVYIHREMFVELLCETIEPG